MSRKIGHPDPAYSVGFRGDVHCGAISSKRLDKFTRDLVSLNGPSVVAQVQVGDIVDSGAAGDATAIPFLAGLTNAPLRAVPGNHDTYGNRTIAQWASALGLLATPWTWDLSFVRIIGVGDVDNTNAGSPSNNLYLPQSHLDYLDAALAAAGSTPCWVVTHAPLQNTVTGPTSGDNPQWSSAETAFFAHGPTYNSADDSAIRTILGNHSNAKAYFCGHTHSDINAPGFFTTLSLGGHSVAHVNCSALYYTGRTQEWNDPLRSIVATWTPTGTELRIWDHGSHTYVGVGIGGPRVTTIAY
jgi:predicted phosphodiesterase